MARYIQDVVLNQPEDFVTFMMNDYLSKNSFTLKTWKGAPAYVRGSFASAFFIEKYRIMTWSYTNGVLHLEACLGGIFGGEMDLSGAWGWMLKDAYRKDIEQLIQLLHQPLPNTAPTGGGSTDADPAGAPGNTNYTQATVIVQTTDNPKAATTALVLGIISICLFWFPYLGFTAGIIAIFFYRSGRVSSQSGKATAGLVCAIIGICIALLIYFLNIVGTVMGIV